MKKMLQPEALFLFPAIFCILVSAVLLAPLSAGAQSVTGEALYKQLSQVANGDGDIRLFAELNSRPRLLEWESAPEVSFEGHVRVIKPKAGTSDKSAPFIYLLRKLTGEVFILTVPVDPSQLQPEADSFYAGLADMYKAKMQFQIKFLTADIDGQSYTFGQFSQKPQHLVIEKVFKISIVLMLFFVMVGMGLTLTVRDFAIVFTKPKGIIIGQILQFGVMPLLALSLGYWLGFYRDYPFIFVGMILITAIPGGVTSNLMTYYAKGDLALSISLTSLSTVLSIFFTPLLLTLYCSHMPAVSIPVKLVVQTILVLVIVPLVLGMSVRSKWPMLAQKATPFLSALGIVALLALILAGVFGNLNVFADTERYGLKFYSTVFALTFCGMMMGIIFPKLAGINNYQTRAISLETGLRNAALSMTIAILIQDPMGDFYSSMLITSGLFGLVMYVAGIVSIVIYKPLLPVDAQEQEDSAVQVADVG